MNYIPIHNDASISLPKENGKYYLNVCDNSYTFEKETRSIIEKSWIFNDDSSVMKNTSFTFNNIPQGKYLLILDTNVYNKFAATTNPEASIGFNEEGRFFSVTEMQGVQSSHIVATHVLDVNHTKLFTIYVKAKNLDNYIFNNFDIKLIPL